MPTHARTQIRNAAIAAVTGLPTTGAEVYSGRTRNLAENHPPTLLVYATDEVDIVDATGHPATLYRTMTLAIEGRVEGNAAETVEDLLDQIAAEVEPAIAAGALLIGLCVEVTLAAIRTNIVSPGVSHIGGIRMEYRVGYRTKENAPTVAV